VKRLLMISLVVLLLAGCSGGLIRPRVEKGIRDALPEYIGPAKEYTVSADGSTTAMMKGLIERLHIEGRDVQIDPNLVLGHISVVMDEVRYHPSTHELESVRSTAFQATISEAAVNRYVEQMQRSDADSQPPPSLHVKLEPGSVLVEFVPKVAGIDVLVSVAGRPVIADGDKVNFQADKASAAHLPVPSYVVNKLLDSANPILDMSVMRFPVTLQDIIVKKGAVVIKGNAQFKPVSTEQ